MLAHYTLNSGEAKPAPSEIGSEERFNDALAHLWQHTATGVSDFKYNGRRRIDRNVGAHINPARCGRHGLGRIQHKIKHNLADLRGIGLDQRQLG